MWILCSWGCVKDKCTARYVQQNGSLELKEDRPHNCDIAKQETLAHRVARLKGKAEAASGKAREPQECYKNLPEEWVIIWFMWTIFIRFIFCDGKILFGENPFAMLPFRFISHNQKAYSVF